jgi:16S rRNA (cytosine967-C5)-methyltransferase
MTPAARVSAAIELQELIDFAANRPADAVANDFFRMRRFAGSGDRRWVSDQVWRVMRARRRLEWWFGGPPSARLLIAASLMFEGATIVALSELFSGAQFAPAAFDRVERALLARLEGRTLDHTGMSGAVRWEVPDWAYPRLEARFGAALPLELAKLQEPAALDLRFNPLKTTREGARTALAKEGLDAIPTTLSPWGLRIHGRRQVTTGVAFQTGLVEIQDEGSQLVAALAGATPGMRVVDYCAGAGGKTLAIAGTMENKGQIVACDVSAARLDGAVRRLRRAGVHNVERHLLTPGDKWAKRREGGFDRVLVDAPCTGTGAWRRNPDARLRLQETDLLELTPKQAAILDAAQSLVRKGGQLVYATCSLLPEENEAQCPPSLTVIPTLPWFLCRAHGN